MGNPYPVKITDDQGEVRLAGAATFTDPGNQPGGGGSQPVLKLAVDHTMLPGLVTGVPIGTLAAGTALSYNQSVQSVPVAWNGTTPTLYVYFEGDDPTVNSLWSGGLGVADTPFGTSGKVVNPSSGDLVNEQFLVTTQVRLMLAVTDGAGGNPGSTAGSLKVIVPIYPA